MAVTTPSQDRGCGWIKGSPAWLQRLERAGVNSVNAVVDITNLVMLEQGQPLHAFDADAGTTHWPTGERPEFDVRVAREGETFVGLDDQKRSLDSRVQVVTCHDRPVAVAGVMGSLESGVSAQTRNIWLESALFAPPRVRQSARALGLRTDASSRFEKGLPVELTLACSARASALLSKEFACTETGRWVGGDSPAEPTPVLLRRSALHQLLGPLQSSAGSQDLEDSAVEACLQALGCTLMSHDEGWLVIAPPSRRQDLHREVDLIEEVARLVGFDRFEAHLPDPLEPGALTPRQQAERRLRHLFCATGLQEVTTLSLVPASETEERIAISNPLLADTSHLRTNLGEEHLQICVRNLKASQSGCSVFEIGNTFSGTAEAVNQSALLGGVICGDRRLSRWNTSGKPQAPDYFQARGVLTRVMEALQLELTDRRLSDDPRLHPGRRPPWSWRDAPWMFRPASPCAGRGWIYPKQRIFELDLVC